MISQRAIAVQGFGFTPKLVSMQGLRPWPDEEKPIFNGALAAAIMRDREILRRRKKRQREEDALFLTAL